MSEKDMWYVRILLGYELIDEERVIKYCSPSFVFGKPSFLILFLCIAMSPMILCIYRVSEAVQILSELSIPCTVFSHAMIDVNSSFWVLYWPDSEKNTMSITSFQIAFFHNALLSKSNFKERS